MDMKIIGHRGARGLAPENTLASLRKGLEHHADQLEFDLRVTKDGIVVLNHDSYMRDASGRKLTIKTHSYEELKQHKPDITTFEEVLKEFADKIPLYIEVKRKVDTRPIIKLLKGQKGDFWLGSKSQKTLRELHKALPEIPKIVIEPISGVRARIRANQVDTKLLAMKQLWLWSGFIRAVARSDFELYAYTLNDSKKAAKWARHGLKGIITDYPDRFEKR
ncbi:MAG TPA: glycerophosphodiester phosphodiesterase [Candidatus Saccharimonadia bacterium]|nr:glycerophosphodiester phosphodiesterase [Candidatus Saccharimonadia bacterium]